ncbi:MAG: hypothetical protein Q9180_006823, partial [Flavoplaca navasiana]
TMIDILLRDVIHLVNDPRERDIPFAAAHPSSTEWAPGSKEWAWKEPVGAVVKPYARLMLLAPRDHRPPSAARAITYGDMVNALVGVNWIRLKYPMLDVNCRIVDDLAERFEDNDLGFLSLHFESNAEDGGVSTVEMVR